MVLETRVIFDNFNKKQCNFSIAGTQASHLVLY
jgi:hypothetical protein